MKLYLAGVKAEGTFDWENLIYEGQMRTRAFMEEGMEIWSSAKYIEVK